MAGKTRPRVLALAATLLLGAVLAEPLPTSAAPSTSPAQGSLPAPTSPCGPLHVGLREYPRLYERDGNGDYQGLDKELFEALSQRSGCRFEIQLESQPRIWVRLERGELDMASWVVPSEERLALVSVIPLITGRQMAMTWRDAGPMTEAGFLANPQLNAVVVRKALYGRGYDDLLARLREQGRLSESADFDSALHVFSAHRVALMLVYPWSLLEQSPEWMSQVQLSDWHANAPGVTSGLAISRSSVQPADRKRLEDAVRAMQLDGSMAQLIARHLPPSVKVLSAAP